MAPSAWVLLAALATAAPHGDPAATRIGAPPAALRLDPFYQKHVSARGIPVIGSARVPDAALIIARDIVNAQLAERRDIRDELIRQGLRVAVIAAEESTTDLPENRGWKKPALDDPRLTACERDEYQARIGRLTDRQYWDQRTRGTGGTLTSVGAENLLAIPGTRYFGENLLVHELSHAMLTAIERIDPGLFERVGKAHRKAIAAGHWKGDYAAISPQEYWAEGSQFWFNSNMISRLEDGTILSHGDLKRYDPALHAALAEVYGSRRRIRADAFHKHAARLNIPMGRKSADC